MPNAVVLRSDIQIDTALQQRLWTVFHEMPHLYESLLAHLAPFGLATEDIRTDAGDGSLAGFNVQFWLMRFRLRVRVRLDRIEWQWNELNAKDLPRFIEAVDKTLAAVAQAGDGTVPKTHEVSTALHLQLDGASGGDVIQRLVSSYPQIGPGTAVTAGVAFYYGPRDEIVRYSVGMEPSTVIPSGLFTRITLTCDGGLSVAQVQERTEGLIRDTMNAVGFEWKREP